MIRVVPSFAPLPLAANWPDPLPDGPLNTPYFYQLTASGGYPPYSFSIASGTLPTGLSLDAASGIISGTPTVPISMDAVSFTVTDSGP